MRHTWLAVIVTCAFAGTASPAPKPRPWQALLKQGASWTLPSADDAKISMTVTIDDAHKVGRADVVRLAYARGSDDDERAELRIRTLAVTANGLYVIDGGGDEEVAKAVKKSPLVGDSPRTTGPSKRTGLWALVPKQRKDAVCVGQVDVPDADGTGCGAAPCEGWVCFDSTGIVGVGGDGQKYGFAPDPIPH
jgi:hypothetical protein